MTMLKQLKIKERSPLSAIPPAGESFVVDKHVRNIDSDFSDSPMLIDELMNRLLSCNRGLFGFGVVVLNDGFDYGFLLQTTLPQRQSSLGTANDTSGEALSKRLRETDCLFENQLKYRRGILVNVNKARARAGVVEWRGRSRRKKCN